jgi:putative DNA primase/helicase
MPAPSSEGSAKLLPSSKRNPCPICGRTKDGSCSVGDSLVFCHHGASHHPPQGLRTGDTLTGGDGETWAYTGEASDGRTARFALNKPLAREHQQQQIPPPPIKGAVGTWHYSPTFIVCRFPGDTPGTKKVRPLSWDGSQWRWRKPPEPRPLLNLQQLIAHSDRPVLITEGEPACDAAARLLPEHVATTWSGGTSNVPATDYSPLEGRTCVLWPDADDVGRKAMAKLAGRLLALGCVVSIVEPPDGAPQGWDLADADGWTTEDVVDHIAASAVTVDPPAAAPATQPPAAPSATHAPPIPSGRPFNLLGFDDDGFFYQPQATGQVIRISRASHTGTNLVALAPLAYWETVYPGKSAPNWTAAASDLFAEQAQHGVYSPDRIRGRGAWWDGGRSVVHLGDRLLVGGDVLPTGRPPGSRYLYERLAAIDGPAAAEPLDDAAALGVLDIACRFLWANPS